MAAGTRVFSINDFALRSEWVCTGGVITSGPTTGQAYKTVDVSIQDDATITGVEMSVTCSDTIGGAAILDVAGIDLEPQTTNLVDLGSIITAPGSYSLKFRFKDRGRGSLSDGTHAKAMDFRTITITVAYTYPDPDVPVDPDVPAGTQESHGLITLHEGIDRDFGASLGLAVLTPTSCVVHEEAGGDYSLTLTHPLTPDGRWRLIQPWRLVRVPVPMSDTPAIDNTGDITLGYDIWVVAAASTGLYDRNYSVSYAAWEGGKTYAQGALVTHQGRNYRCKVPNNYQDWWPGVWQDLGTGQPVSKRAVGNGTRLYVSTSNATWLTVTLSTGETGYCKKADCTFVREATQEDIDALRTGARSVRSQVFRLTEVTVTEREVSARGLHVSYDYSMQVVDGLTLADSGLVDAVQDLRARVMGGAEPPAVYCEDTDVTINTSWSTGSSPVEALLNPDTGLVRKARARLIRDNWDFFLIKNEVDGEQGTDRGYRIEYGVNLTGISWQRDFSALITRVIPVGKKQNGDPLYLTDDGTGTIWVESDIADVYPVTAWTYAQIGVQVGKQAPDGTTYTTETARTEMRKQAAAYFTEQHQDQPAVELTVRFVQLGTTEAFRQYRDLERLSLYDRVTVVHPDLGLNTSVQVKAYDWDAVRQRFESITLGDVFLCDTAALAGWQLANGSITAEKLAPGVLT